MICLAKLTIIQGDTLPVLEKMLSGSVDCIMTSPPYWSLRDYHIAGQIGLEPTFKKYVSKLLKIFSEANRVLKESGTCWINFGDTYFQSNVGNYSGNMRGIHRRLRGMGRRTRQKQTIQEKSLCLIPFRFATGMVDHGWICRNVLIWHKPNCLPASAMDRFTVDFEYLFFFTKSKKYWFDQQLEPVKEETKRRYQHGFTYSTPGSAYPNERREKPHNWRLNRQTRNKRCVWPISTKPFPEAHFAVYPEELCETPIRAGCPPDGTVLDPFMGSGTTLKVASSLNRNTIGIELKPDYIEIAKRRLEWKEESTDYIFRT